MSTTSTSAIPPNQTLYFAYGSNLSPTQMASRCPASTLLGIARLPGWRWHINERGYANVVDCGEDGKGPDPAENVVERAPATNALPEDTERSVQSRSENAERLGSAPVRPDEDGDNVVWGLLYALPPSDEELLDMYEGVPSAYGKEWVQMRLWPLSTGGSDREPDAGALEEAAELNTKLLTVADPFGPEATRNATAAPVSLPSGKAVIEGRGQAVMGLVYVDRERVGWGTVREEYISRMKRGILESGERGLPKEWCRRVIEAGMERSRENKVRHVEVDESAGAGRRR